MKALFKFALALSSALVTPAIWIGCGGSSSSTPASDGGTPSYGACSGPGQCLALVPGCCGGCGAPTRDDVVGVNSAKVDAFRAATCGDPHPVCPACPTVLEPNLVSFCQNERCEPLDIRKEDVSACTQDSDCMLREPACCESANPVPFGLVAIAKSKVEEYRAEVCTPSQACSKCGASTKCVTTYPEGWAATCGSDGHCAVVQKDNVCPADQPTSGEPCALRATLACEYGDDIRPGCRTRITCPAGAWQVADSGCPPLPGPGEQGCPSVASSDTCSPDGLACDLGGDSVCVCTACSGPCSQIPYWACSVPPTTPGCSSRPPRLGSACDTEGLVCLYGAMCAPPVAAGRRCKDGAWVDEPLACPA